MGLFDFVGYGILYDKFKGSDSFGIYLLIATLFVIALGYFVGSLNGAAIVSKYVIHDDVRLYGSKNAGMTNMIRVFGKKAGAVTCVIDVLKTAFCVFVGCILGRITFLPYIAGLACLIGHSFPCYFGFKGGKGVLVCATVMLCMSLPVFACEVLIWVAVLLFTKYVSVASIISALMYPFILDRINALFHSVSEVYINSTLDVVIAFVMACLIIFLHRTNIKRLKQGTENKIGKKKDGDKKDGN